MSELREAYKAFIKAKDYRKALECVKYLYRDENDYESVVDFRKRISKIFQKNKKPNLMDMARDTYMLTAQDVFDDYMVAMEWERPMKEKFYIPRRKFLRPFVDGLQRLTDRELDILGISAPPGIGKTGLGDFYLTFRAGRNPELANLMGSHSNSILNDNYNECLRMMTSDEYLWTEIFPLHRVVKTNAADLKIDVDRPSKFSSLQYASIGSQLAGRVRAMGILYADDLVPSLEIAMSKERLDKLYNSWVTDYKQRMQGECQILMIATRWSIYDPLGREEAANEGNERALFIRTPALNEKGESNYDYGGENGFTTKFYLDIKKNMDQVLWSALYQNEPIEREGQLYSEAELKTYFDLPSEEPDGIIAVCDTKDRGTDDLALIIAYQYGDAYYIEDLICDPSTPEITTPRVANKLNEHKVKMARFESNSAGGYMARDVQRLVKESGGVTSISTKFSTANKETKIIMNSGWVKEHCLFKDSTLRSLEYNTGMRKLCSYSLVSKNKTDDMPDAMSMLADFAQSFEMNVITVGRRFF